MNGLMTASSTKHGAVACPEAYRLQQRLCVSEAQGAYRSMGRLTSLQESVDCPSCAGCRKAVAGD